MADQNMPRSVLFYRDLRHFTGGHLKVWHYYRHLKGSEGFDPRIFFSDKTIWDENNPWLKEEKAIEKIWDPQKAEVLFLAGVDWLMLDQYGFPPHKIPIVNLIQGMRHADPNDIRYGFLSRKAIRIGVSGQITDALSKTGKVNGPLFTIPNAIDLDQLPRILDWNDRNIHVLVCGLKNQALARQLAILLSQMGITVETQLDYLPRYIFLEKISKTRIVVLLPLEREGFYLPALEAMALGAIVICPDCAGNRSFCSDGVNCFMPNYTLEEIAKATTRARYFNMIDRQIMIANARKTVSKHDLAIEKSEFIKIMQNLNTIW